MDGSNGNYNPSGVDLDKTKGNVYALQWQYLGYDPQALYVEVVPPGDNNVIFILAHQNNYLNENNYPSVVNPAAPVYIEARSLGAAASRMVRTGSVAGFIEGHVAPAKGMPIASNLSAALGTTEIPLFTLRMPHTTDSVANQVIAELHKLNLSFKPQTANYYATLRVRRNATLTGGTNYARHYPYGAMLIDKTATGISGGTIEFEVTLTDTGTLPYDFDEQNLLLDPGDTLSFTAVANNGTTNIVSMSATFGEIR